MLLEIRKINNHPTVLLLGARAGRLFRSEHFYDSLRKVSNRDFSQLSRAEQFGECYSILTQGRFSETEIHSILSTSLKNLAVTKADACLAELVKHEHFDEIISTNIDDMLEDAFTQAEMKEGREFEVFRVGRGTSRSEKSFPCRITKVFGDLVSRVYTVKERLSHLDSNPELKEFLQRLLVRDILVIGIDPIWDEDILRAMPGKTKGTMWFVNEEKNLTELSLISSILRARQTMSILEKEGSYDHCARTLHGYLYGGVPINYELAITISNHLLTISNQLPDIVSQLQSLQDGKKTILGQLQSLQDEHKLILSEIKKIQSEIGNLSQHQCEI